MTQLDVIATTTTTTKNNNNENGTFGVSTDTHIVLTFDMSSDGPEFNNRKAI